MTATGTVAWFDLARQFGFVTLSNGYGDAFLHMSVLKEAGYVWLPRGTTVRVRIEEDRGKQRVAEVLEIDPAPPGRGRRSRSCASPRPECPRPVLRNSQNTQYGTSFKVFGA